MPSGGSGFTTKELSKRTWADFEWLFSQGNGWDHCWCMAYQGGNKAGPRRAERSAINREDKRRLVEEGKAHGILVYAEREPVGWCQFGPEDELPFKTREATDTPRLEQTLWRITCFVTQKGWQGKGVAQVALRRALEAISEKGGGLVEGYPYAQATEVPSTPEITSRFAELVRSHGRNSPEVKAEWYRRENGVFYEAGKAVLVEQALDGVGPVNALCRWWGPAFHVGTVSMFEREGFKAVGAVEPSTKRRRSSPGSGRVHPTRVVMRRLVP